MPPYRALAACANTSTPGSVTPLSLGLFAAFAVTSMMLAVLGLYGLVSYSVSQRTAEIGLRIAIGATQGQYAA